MSDHIQTQNTQDSQDKPLPYDKSAIVSKIKLLLALIEGAPRKEKYAHIIEIYDFLASNPQFVKDHHKFYLTLKSNANTLVKDMVRILKTNPPESSEIESMYKAICSIVNCVKTLDEVAN